MVQGLEEALQGEGLVLTRETDFAALDHYLTTQAPGSLHVVMESEDGDMSSDIECTYGVLPTGEYIIRWYSESIEEVMTNGKTYLAAGKPGVEIFFTRARELFFGDTKAFIVCTPAPSEPQVTNG